MTDSPRSNRLKVLVSAYACEPGQGSEPGVGWNVVTQLALHHEVWVMTRASNRGSIESRLPAELEGHLHFVYFDLPSWARFWKRGNRGVQVYYYLWQLAIYRIAHRLHREVRFDVAHHVTFVRYWTPSLLSLLPVPFLWGPVGGGESAPPSFQKGFSPRGRRYEKLRSLAREVAELDPLLRWTARRSALALATTRETEARLQRLGARRTEVFGESGLTFEEIDALAHERCSTSARRFVSMGRLLHWKGYHLSLEAFALAGLEDAEYWILGDGPERSVLERLATHLRIHGQVRFLGHVSRDDAMSVLVDSLCLVHPSLHDSGGWVCIEAMAARRPVICLDIGGPSEQVNEETGFVISTHDPVATVQLMAGAMRRIAGDQKLAARMGRAGERRARKHYSWESKSARVSQYYEAVLGEDTEE